MRKILIIIGVLISLACIRSYAATLYIDTNLVDVTEAPWNEFTDNIRSISELH